MLVLKRRLPANPICKQQIIFLSLSYAYKVCYSNTCAPFCTAEDNISTLYYTPCVKLPVQDTDLTDSGCFTKTASSRPAAVTAVSKIKLRSYTQHSLLVIYPLSVERQIDELTFPARGTDTLVKTRQRQQKLHKGKESDVHEGCLHFFSFFEWPNTTMAKGS